MHFFVVLLKIVLGDVLNKCNYDEARNILGFNRCSESESCQQCAGKRTCSSSGYCQGTSGCSSAFSSVSACCDKFCKTCSSKSKLIFVNFIKIMFVWLVKSDIH